MGQLSPSPTVSPLSLFCAGFVIVTPWMIHNARPRAFPALISCGAAASEPRVPQHPSLQGELAQLPPPEPCPSHCMRERPGRAQGKQWGTAGCWRAHSPGSTQRKRGWSDTQGGGSPSGLAAPDPQMLLCWSKGREFLKACEHGKDTFSDCRSLLFISCVDKDLFFSI